MSQQPPYRSTQGGVSEQMGQLGEQMGSAGGQMIDQMTGQGSQQGLGGQSQPTGQSQQPTGQGGQQPMSQQPTGQQSQAMGQAPPGVQQLASALSEAIEVCGWCADQCIQESNPHMVECIRLCEDVTELGESALALVPRNSRFADDVLQTFQQAAQACAQECGQHQAGHCQECASVLGRVVQTTQQFTGGQGGSF